ncbi:MAG: hypothetical protein IJB47_00445 [Oscillospiraceae bacterium]|nr:hypothetical protein [Oscillospiraceae bacterium]
MEQKFCEAWSVARKTAEELGIRFRPLDEDVLKAAHRMLSGHRESDGFTQLLGKGRLDLSLEALAVKKQFTGLFTDEEANNALTRLLEAGYGF